MASRRRLARALCLDPHRCTRANESGHRARLPNGSAHVDEPRVGGEAVVQLPSLRLRHRQSIEGGNDWLYGGLEDIPGFEAHLAVMQRPNCHCCGAGHGYAAQSDDRLSPFS